MSATTPAWVAEAAKEIGEGAARIVHDMQIQMGFKAQPDLQKKAAEGFARNAEKSIIKHLP